MEVRARNSFKYEFVLSEQELRSLDEILVQRMKRVVSDNDFLEQFSLTFRDKLGNHAGSEKASLDDIFSENNGDVWEVQRLEILMQTHSSTTRYQIKLTFKKMVTFDPYSIAYDIEANDRDWTSITASHLEDRIKRIKRFPFGKVGENLLGTLLLLCFFSFFAFIGLAHAHELSFSLPLIMFLLILLILFGISFTLLYFFPRYNFYWGDYIDIYNKKRSIGQFILNTLLVGFVLGMVTGITSAIIVNFFSK